MKMLFLGMIMLPDSLLNWLIPNDVNIFISNWIYEQQKPIGKNPFIFIGLWWKSWWK